MLEAVRSNYYNHEYGSTRNDEVLRVILQEYAYWVITSSWDISKDYTDGGNGEWTLGSKRDFMRSQSEMYSVFSRTVPKVMVAPSRTKLDEFESNRRNRRNRR